jgi:hypothetical protein
MKEEQRHHERIRFPLELRWEGLSGKHEARVYDISLSGFYIESLRQVQLGEQIRFEIQSPTGRWHAFQGEIVHYQPNIGFGVRLSEMSDLQRNTLAELIHYASLTSD